jgi:uncharacterized protein YqeY
MTSNASEKMKLRLRADLKRAMKERRGDELRVLRSLLAALDNAEAPAVATTAMAMEQMGGLGSTEIQRLALDEDQVRATFAAQEAERNAAAAEFDRIGRDDHAAASRAEAAVIRRYLV